MNLEIETCDFFGLITDLCKSLVNKRRMECHRRDDPRIVNEMRTIAFAILLNKHHRCININDDEQVVDFDPVAELLKYCFVLKTTTNSFSSAIKLENALNCLMDVDGNYDSSLKSVLTFLYHLKENQPADDNNLDPFQITVRHSELSETHQWGQDIPRYQLYPLSMLELPMRIDRLLDKSDYEFSSSNLGTPVSGLFQLSPGILHNEFPIATPLSSYDLSLKDNFGEAYYTIKENHIAALPWHQEEIQVQHVDSEDVSSISIVSSTSPSGNPDFVEEVYNYTWETIGDAVTSEHLTFISESTVATQIFENLRYPLSHPGEVYNCRYKRSGDITMDEFIEDSKFVLLAIESSTYVWNDAIGFTFDNNTTVSGLSRRSLQNICSEITHWATCFKLLSLLVHPNIKLGELRPDDLIYQALCSSIDDILIHYQAIIVHVFSYNNSLTLLNLLDRLRGIGFLISEVARLCRCDKICDLTLGEGTGILSHIYNEVTKVTKPEIALVYYSVLKSCCEVYFRLLEKWMFEGICDQTCGEFMININVQYLHNRGHKFWTRCFGINKAAVPGFLKNLAGSILECGKAVRLLKICDPKNPMCHFFTINRPTVKVCLNMEMLSEQEKICLEYMADGTEILGANVTLSSALREMKAIEKEKGDRVNAAQFHTLDRIKRRREEAKLRLIQSKRELLVDQKKQYEDAAIRKAEAKATIIRNDRLIMKQQLLEDEKFRSKQLAEIQITSDYYKELGIEIEKRSLRSKWRAKRMALFDERVMAISMACIDEAHSIDTEQSDHRSNCLPADNIAVEDDSRITNSNTKQQKSKTDCATGDENCNSSDQQISQKPTIVKDEQIRADRPTILDITRTIRIFKNKTIDNQSKNTTRRETEVISNELPQSNLSLATREVLSNDNNCNIIILDGKDNDGNTIVENINEPKNLNEARINLTEGAHLPQLSTNDMNDATPMSCTTDSYLPSATGSSIMYNCTTADSAGESKSEFGMSTTPADCLTSDTMKHEYSIDNIFTSDSLCFNQFPSDNRSSPMIETSLTNADVEMIDNTSLQIYLEKSVLLPLRIQRQLANSAIIKCLLHDHKILLHLQSLRSFFFLLNGEFAKNLTCPLYTKLYEISSPVQLFNSHTLTNLLKNALHCSLSSTYINSELLSLTAFEIPSILQILDPQALNCLCLHYKVSWPLNIILDEASMQQYSKVFKFLLMVGRVLWVLQEDFCILKHERKAAQSYQYHRVQLIRHAMMQFMTALQNYITCSVLHASWTEFEKELENTRTLDQIYTTHVSYIKKILSRCMLTNRGEKLRICLRNIFEIILKFHNCLRSHEWIANSTSYIHPNYKKMEQMYSAFCILRTYPAQVVDRSASSGYQMHLSHFVDALNINPLFTLSAT